MSKQVAISHFNSFGVKTGETRTFYVDGFPQEIKEKLGRNWKDEWQLAKLNLKFYNHKYTEGDSSVVAQVRSLYDGIEQPNKALVKRAMILLINEDYGLKAGGESASDNYFSSSLCIWIADPKTGEDKKVVLIKKYSTDFDEVLIRMGEVEELFEACLTSKERQGVLYDEALSIARELQRREMGFKSQFNDGKRVMSKDYAKKTIALYKGRGVTLEMYNKAIDAVVKFITPDLTTQIIEDQPGVNKTEAYQKNAQNRLDAILRAKEFIKNEYMVYPTGVEPVSSD